MSANVAQAVSTLTVYDGRLRLGTIDVSYVDGRPEYRARLSNGRKLGEFKTQKAARDAIEVACAERDQELSEDGSG